MRGSPSGSGAVAAGPSLDPEVDDQREGEEEHRDHRVEPVVVGGQHDRRERDDRVEQHEVAPAAVDSCGDDHRPCDHHRPPEVQRRHGRELVGEPLVRAARAVRIRSEDAGRVDEPEVREHPGRRQRHREVHDHPGERDHHHHVAEPPVPLRTERVQPDERGGGHHGVREQVVHVQELHERGVVEDQILQLGLAEHAERPLEVDDVAGVVDGGADMAGRQEPPVLVGEEERDDQHQLPHQGAAEA